MNYTEAMTSLIWNLRLDYDPVGITFIADSSAAETLVVTHRSKAKLSFCQYVAAARSAKYAIYMPQDKLSCVNAQAVFGFRKPDKNVDLKTHFKYLRESELAWKAFEAKEKLNHERCAGIYMAPLETFDKSAATPDVVFCMVTPYQAYHLLNDYMGATGKPNLNFSATVNSAVCSGSIYALNHQTANMTTMCAGSKTSGKTEMNYMNLFIPGNEIIPLVSQMTKRIEETGGPSLLGKGGQPWPGFDVCVGCPLVKFEKIDS